MSDTSNILFGFLREIFYASPDAKLDLDKLEEDYVMLGRGLMFFALCYSQYNEFANALARGDLSTQPPPPENELAAPLKSLHASLKHLTWQSKQVAMGDYKQHVDFMGEFADAFNMMVEQLADRQQKLEDEIASSKKHVEALEQGNHLLENVTRHIPQQIFVVSEGDHEILLKNEMAEREIAGDPAFLEKIMEELAKCEDQEPPHSKEIKLEQDGTTRFFSVISYNIEWEKVNAEALLINDISDERKQIEDLKTQVYRDSMTHLFNRFYGMLELNEWLEKKVRFALVFVDMDNLKYVNDEFGHIDGDRYISCVAKCLGTYSGNALVCRIGGDEFMMLVPDADEEQARDRMLELQSLLEKDDYLDDKDFSYSISFGIVAVNENNELSASDILSLADERMYEHKRARKKERQAAKPPA